MADLESWLERARAVNPGVSDADLTNYYQEKHAPAPATLPTLESWITRAREANPDADDDQLTDFWQKKYGAHGAKEKESTEGDVSRGFKESFKQLPQLTYGLVAGAGAAAESLVGEGGIATGVKKFGVDKFQEKSKEIAADSKPSDSAIYAYEQATQGNFGAFADWLQHTLGYAGGQVLQMLATGGAGYVGGKLALGAVAKTTAEKLVTKEASRLAGTEAGAGLAGEELTKLATANVARKAGQIGQTTALGGTAVGMEGGEIFGDLTSDATKEGRTLSGAELAKALGASLAAGALEFVGDKVGLDLIVGKSPIGKIANTLPGMTGKVARAGIQAGTAGTIEGGTEFAQTLIEEVGKGKEPFSDASIREAIDASAIGIVAGGAVGTTTGLVSRAQWTPVPTPVTAPGTDESLRRTWDLFDEDAAMQARNAERTISIPEAVGVGQPEVSVDAAIRRTWDLLDEDSATQERNLFAAARQVAIPDQLLPRTGTEIPILQGPATGTPPVIQPGSAFTPRTETVDPRETIAQERARLIQSGGVRRTPDSEPAPSAPTRSSGLIGSAIDKAYASVDDIHRLAESKGLAWDNNPTFMELTKQVTGKAHLDQLTPAERDRFADTLKSIQSQPGAVPVRATPTQLLAEQNKKPSQSGVAPAVEPMSASPRSIEGTTTPQTPSVETAPIIDTKAHDAATSPQNDRPEPSDAQFDAGNYKKGHIRLAGLDISIENPEGSERSGTDADGKAWSVTMKSHYGYIRGTKGKDKDHIDAFIKKGTPDDYSGPVFVVDQKNPQTGRFDEHKVVFGASTMEEAKQLYQENYAKGWERIKSVKGFTMPEFHLWLKAGNHQKPAGSAQDDDTRDAPQAAPVVETASVPADTKPAEPAQTPERPGQQSIAVPPPTIGGKPIIRPEAPRSKTPLFSRQAQTPEPEQTALSEEKPEEPNKLISKTAEASGKLARFVSKALDAGRTIEPDAFFEMADNYFGGTRAKGTYNEKDAYDALELGVNQYLQDVGGTGGVNPNGSASHAQETVDWIRQNILDRIPTQRLARTQEQNEFQQFSTPPDLAYVLNWVAKIRASDTVLEPSAGIGGIAVFANTIADTVYVNEYSARRAELLRQLGFSKVFAENAEQIHNILPKDVKPTVVVMNPPFSSTAGRKEGERSSRNVLRHLDQGLARLQPGGRLVALIGQGRDGKDPQFLEDWKKLTGTRYAYRGRIGLSGQGYKKYGTTYDNQILIFDKIKPDGRAPINANVEDVRDAIPLLAEVRDARDQESAGDSQNDQSASAQPGSAAVARPGKSGARSESTVPPATDAVGTGGQRPRPDAGQSSRPTGETAPDRGRAPSESGQDVRPELPPARTGTSERRPVTPESSNATEQPGPEGRRDAESGQPGESRIERPDAGSELSGRVDLEQAEDETPTERTDSDNDNSIFEAYRPKKVKIAGAKAHPSKLVESAAMAAVELPNAIYQPSLPKAVIEGGRLSLAQLETPVYAGQAHAQLLPDGSRRGFFNGDGTGVGKGREIAALILDNMKQGRKKAVWLSKSSDLFSSAVRDWKDVAGGKGEELFAQGKMKLADGIDRKDGILFTTYNLLGDGLDLSTTGNLEAKKREGGPNQTRLDQLVNWLGKDFDGVLVFDEAHEMRNNMQRKGARGAQKPAMKALAGVELQKRFPKARIAYFSATGGIDVSDFGYAERLGMWGAGTPFSDKRNFVGAIESGGLASMELVAQDLKANGLYLSRSLSYEDVTYERVIHALTANQRDIYDEMARGWQTVLQHLNQALELTGANKNGNAKSAARSAFWGAQQRFFNQILTALQLPTVIERIQKDIDDGQAVVIQLVNTNEAAQNRQIKEKAQEGAELDDLDLTPRENLMQYLDKAFPTQEFQEYTDDNGNTRSQLVFASDGTPVQNEEAVAMKQELMEQIGSLKVPEGPLEMIINKFGPDVVAEVTGRSKRVVRLRDADGNQQTVIQKRTRNVAMKEAADFMDDKRSILVFSDAGGTGQSFHADLSKKNQRRRMHYVVQPGWRADAAIQGLGRTHRTNQKSAPHYLLVSTDLNGHKRFISTIARRLAQLGALTKGQRQTTQGLFSEKDNLENAYASGSIRQFFVDLKNGRIEGFGWDELTAKLGLEGLIDEKGSLMESKLPDVPQFLNRILCLEYEDQNTVFDQFFGRMERAIEMAEANGTLDTGMENYRADSVTLRKEQVVYENPDTKAKTKLLTFDAKHKLNFLEYGSISKKSKFGGFAIGSKTGKIYATFIGGYQHTDEKGNVEEQVKLQEPDSRKTRMVSDKTFRDNYRKVSGDEAKRAWQQAIENAPHFEEETLHLLSGSLLKIWDRLGGSTRVFRVVTDTGKRVVGRVIPEENLTGTMERLGVEADQQSFSTDKVLEALEEGGTVELANGWKITSRTVADEQRFELIGDNLYGFRNELTGYGAFVESRNYKTRFFVPTDKAADIIGKITQHRPVLRIQKRKSGEVGGGVAEPAAPYSVTAPIFPITPQRNRSVLTEGQVLFDNQAPYEQRSGEPAQHNLSTARDAIGDLDRLTESVSDRPGDMGRPRGPRSNRQEAERLAGLEQAGIRTLAVGISKDLATKGRVDLRSYSVTSMADLAAIAQVFRDPRIETLRFFYVKDGTIVGHEGVTSRMPGSSSAFPISAGKLETLTRDKRFTLQNQVIADMQDRMDRLGADGYYILHNHPSGQSKPSSDDVLLTRRFAESLPGFQGHVIIDSGEYSTIGTDHEVTTRPLGDPEADDHLLEPARPHPWLNTVLRSTRALAQLGKAIQTPSGYITIVYRAGGEGRVRAIQEIPTRLFANVQEATNFLRGQARAFGATSVLAYSNSEEDTVVWRAARDLQKTGALLDFIGRIRGGLAALSQYGNAKAEGITFGVPDHLMGGQRIQEPTTTYADEGLTYDELNADEFAGLPVAEQQEALAYHLPAMSKMDDVVRTLQDKNIDMVRLVESIKSAGGSVADDLNPVLKEELYLGRVSKLNQDFLTDELRPLIDAMRLNKVTMDQLDSYLYARHAKEANAYLADINPDRDDNEALSGMTDEEADRILAAADRPKMDRLAARVDTILSKTRRQLVDYGLEAQETVDAWREHYSFYVPLHRAGYEDEGPRTGQGRSVRGAHAKARTGSRRAATNILANVAMDRERAIVRGEKMRPVIALAGLLQQYPNKNIAQLVKPAQITYTNPDTGLEETAISAVGEYRIPMVKRLNRKTGKVQWYPDPAYKGRDNVINFRVNGTDHAIVFNEENDRAVEMARALKDLDVGQLNTILSSIAPVTRYMASINTQFNPVFGVVNFIRDVQFAMLTLNTTPLADKKSEVLKGTWKAIRGIYQDARAVRRGEHSTSQTAQLWARFQKVGGPTGYRDLFRTSNDRAKAIEHMLDPEWWQHTLGGKILTAGGHLSTAEQALLEKGAKPVFEWLSDYNQAMENSVRLGVFQAGIQHGMSDEAAASLAKNITVNFNKKGKITAQLGSLYAFFNASVQGTTRIFETLFETGKFGTLSAVGKKIIAGGVTLGAIQTFALSMAGFDDDDPPEWLKERSLIIPIPGTERGYVSIPMPLGFNILPSIGRLASESLIYGKPMERAGHFLGTLLDAFSPVGGAATAGQFLAPTVADPMVALSENKDWSGRRIFKADMNSLRPTPGMTRTKDSSTPWARGMAEVINYATGGTEYTPGKFSPTPDAIDYLIGQFTGGVGRELSKVSQTAYDLTTGEDTPFYKMPLVGRLVGTASDTAATRNEFYEHLRELNQHEQEVKGRRLHGEETAGYLREHPEARMAKEANHLDREIQTLTRRKRDLLRRGANADQIKLVEHQIRTRMERFNQKVRTLQRN